MGAANGDYPLSQIADAVSVPVDHLTTWESVDAEFRSLLAPITLGLSADELSPAEAGDLFSTLLRAHLESLNLIQPVNKRVLRRTRHIEKMTEELKVQKNSSRKLMKSSPHRFFNLVRAYNRAKKARDRWLEGYNLRKNERAFRKNPWHFAKSACKEGEETSSGD